MPPKKSKPQHLVIFDTETTGLPRNWKIPPARDVNNWPRLVQLGWIVCAEDGQTISEHSLLVRPEGFVIPAAAAKVHGITTAKALAEGQALQEVLDAFVAAITDAALLISHNFKFDENILEAEFIRAQQPSPLAQRPRLCVMEKSTEFCGLPGPYGFKWPKLEELYGILFGRLPQRSHDAGADARTCRDCYFELKRRKII